MRGRTKMLLAQEAERRRGRGNDYGNPYDNEKPNNRYNDGNGEMRDRPYYGYDNKPVNIYIPPMSPSNNDYRGSEYRDTEYGQFPPPMYRGEYEQPQERRIGFDGSGYGGQMHGGRTETNSRNLYFNGSSHYKAEQGVDKEQAEEWTSKMMNSDGSRGAHWDMNEAKMLKEKLNLNSIDPVEFYVAVNMMYSDYCGIAKQFGVDKPEFYGHLAKAFLTDKDAGPDKLSKYFSEVVGN